MLHCVNNGYFFVRCPRYSYTFHFIVLLLTCHRTVIFAITWQQAFCQEQQEEICGEWMSCIKNKYSQSQKLPLRIKQVTVTAASCVLTVLRLHCSRHQNVITAVIGSHFLKMPWICDCGEVSSWDSLVRGWGGWGICKIKICWSQCLPAFLVIANKTSRVCTKDFFYILAHFEMFV